MTKTLNNRNMKTIGKYETAFEANLIKGVLESEGIIAEVLHENIPYPLNSDLFSIDLVVSDEDYERAQKILAASFNS